MLGVVDQGLGCSRNRGWVADESRERNTSGVPLLSLLLSAALLLSAELGEAADKDLNRCELEQCITGVPSFGLPAALRLFRWWKRETGRLLILAELLRRTDNIFFFLPV